MKVTLQIPAVVYNKLHQHLLPENHVDEEAAFVFVIALEGQDKVTFEYKEWYAVRPEDYASRSAYHFELTDEMRAMLIKKAHDLGAAIVEFHSHIDQEYVRFSPTDWRGFSDFVPHVFWRLKGKPYVAVVVSRIGFDALVWLDDPRKPEALDAIVVGDEKLIPTNDSLKSGNRGW